VMLAIAGDSAAGKTTLTQGLVEALGPGATVSVCVDDYHKYDRQERKDKPFTPLHPDCNYIGIMEQHLQLLATGQPILKPVYDHGTGELTRPEVVDPNRAVIIEGLLPLHTPVMRACFDVSVYLDPPEDIRREWKIKRDTTKRGYEAEQVLAELERREPESEAYIRPQRSFADIVVRFAPIEGRDDPPDTPLSATVLLRPTIRHPKLHEMMEDVGDKAMHLKLMRDDDGKPVDALHIHGHAPPEDSRTVAEAIWGSLGTDKPLPDTLGQLGPGERSEPLALTQLILLYHLLRPRG
jgi:phosphoribulokinase